MPRPEYEARVHDAIVRVSVSFLRCANRSWRTSPIVAAILQAVAPPKSLQVTCWRTLGTRALEGGGDDRRGAR